MRKMSKEMKEKMLQEIATAQEYADRKSVV